MRRLRPVGRDACHFDESHEVDLFVECLEIGRGEKEGRGSESSQAAVPTYVP